MTRRPQSNSRQAGTPVALFPFLAVLVCTMGALIVILVVLARQAKLQAARAVQSRHTEQIEDLAREREMAEWRISTLAEARRRAQEQLADARLRLGHIEEHTRQLEKRLAELRSQQEALASGAVSSSPEAGTQDRRAVLRAELAKIEGQIAEARKRLAEVYAAAGAKGKSYAVVPYRGANGTFRRPIYLECRADAVVIQPEGIELAPADFESPLGPDNPLATALRAAREHLASQGVLDLAAGEEPYPLLIVRPEGIMAFYAAREALRSWGAEFGYELVGSDWQLRYPPSPPGLRATVEKAVATARMEQRVLGLAMRAAGTPSGNSALPSAKTVYRIAPGGGGLVQEDSGGADDKVARRLAFSSRGNRPADSPPRTVHAPPSHDSKPNAVSQDPSVRQAGGQSGPPLRPGEWIPQERPRQQELPTNDPPSDKTQSLALTRGKNWALPDATRDAVPVSRPILLRCEPDRLIVFRDSGGQVEQIVELAPRTEASMDQLIGAIWEHMRRWGIAGRKMYWRPVLRVDVAPGAEDRFHQLQALLEDSGLDIERRVTGTAPLSETTDGSPSPAPQVPARQSDKP